MSEPVTAVAASTQRKTKQLAPAQVDAFARSGYHFPLRALSADEALGYRRRLEQSEAALGGPMRGTLRSKPHLLFRWANELIRHPAVLDAVEDILGPNLLAWSSSFFIKDARDPSYVSWHQDSTYWGLSHPDVVTAWIALSVSIVENGCMRVIPGSHLKDQLPHQDTYAENNLLTRGQEVMVEVNEADAVDVELQPGEFSLHHVRLVHGSDPNNADYRRIGYAVRYIPTYVRQTEGPRDCATLVRGVDTYHYFDPEPVPRADLDPEAVEAHRRITEEANKILYRGTDKRNPK
jgi:ectoine hydroxylase-related dioxygenase (phytanoyl-CoA dioxygenase family)